MSFFNRQSRISPPALQDDRNLADLASIALNIVNDGVVMTDAVGVVNFINPAALTMTGYTSANEVIGLDFGLIIKLETRDGQELKDEINPLLHAIKSNQSLESYGCSLIVRNTSKRIPIIIFALSANGRHLIVFHDVTKDLRDTNEQGDFISTASHEMRTPVATIDGYLSLALNPQTASIDERARGYLDAAHKASQHLGKLFQDLLDATKLDDGRIRPKFRPIEITKFVAELINDFNVQTEKAGIKLIFGSDINGSSTGDERRLEQVTYVLVDTNFMREIMNNLLDNAIKYTPGDGDVIVNVKGESDRVLISVKDSGIGISPNDLPHIFQKFYRADNSDTRTIGGTGLGLYLVKQRVEAMNGRVWAESILGHGSTFYVSLPRLSQADYEKYMISIYNSQNGGQQ